MYLDDDKKMNENISSGANGQLFGTANNNYLELTGNNLELPHSKTIEVSLLKDRVLSEIRCTQDHDVERSAEQSLGKH